MIVDTSALLAYFDRNEPAHASCAAVLDSSDDDLIVSPFVLAELDYLVSTRVGVDAELAVLSELASGAWSIADIATEDIVAAARVVERYRDQSIGLADATNVVLADRHDTRTILTLDRRHFTVLRPLRGGRFRILP